MQVMTDPTYFGPSAYGEVIDDVWIVQHHHGPFNRTALSNSYTLDRKPGRTVDHWQTVHPQHPLEPGFRFKDDPNEQRLEDFLRSQREEHASGSSQMPAQWEDSNAHAREHALGPGATRGTHGRAHERGSP